MDRQIGCLIDTKSLIQEMELISHVFNKEKIYLISFNPFWLFDFIKLDLISMKSKLDEHPDNTIFLFFCRDFIIE